MPVKTIRFPNESDTHYGILSMGRNGSLRTCGVEISTFTGTAQIAPLRQNGAPFTNAHVGLPVEHLPSLAAIALEAYVDAMVQDGTTTAHARMEAYAKLASVIAIVAPSETEENDCKAGGSNNDR